MKKQTLAESLANKTAAFWNCHKSGNGEWVARHQEAALALVKEHMPSGSGFDAGTVFMLEDSTADKLIFVTSFHHMTEHGFYDGWTEHKVIVTPSFIGRFDLRVTGRNRNGIKEYIADVFHAALSKEVD